MLQFLAEATSAAAPDAGDQLMSTLFMFGMIFVIFYFLIIRPQQKKFKEHQALVDGIQKNDSVITNSGIFGKVTKVDKDNGIFDLQIADGVEIKVLSNTISAVTDEKIKFANDNSAKKKKK